MKEITILKRRILHNLKEAARSFTGEIQVNYAISKLLPKSYMTINDKGICSIRVDKYYFPINFAINNEKYLMHFEDLTLDLAEEEDEFKRRMKLLIFS